MLTLFDSFVKHIQVKLAGAPAVHWLRVSAREPTLNVLKMDHLNVTILDVLERDSMEEALVSLDILGNDERQVWAWAATVRDALIDPQVIPEKDYSVNPLNPTATGRAVSWEGRRVSFEHARSEPRFVHVNCTLPVRHARV